MLLVTADDLKNSLTPDQKKQLVEKITTALVEIGSENTRPATWVRINEFEGGDWAIGGRRLSAYDVLEIKRGKGSRSLETSIEG
jgi:4-oxalocrotonate tautomerase